MPDTTFHRPDCTEELAAALRERILVIDGAMGTVIQRRPPRRGGLPRRAVRRLAVRRPGQQRPAHADPARHHPRRSTASTSRPAPTSSRPTPSTPTRSRWPTTAWRTSPTSSTTSRPGWPARPCDEVTERTPDRPRYVAGALGPTNRTASISPDVNDPGARNVTYDQLVEAYLEATKRPGRRRRRPAAHRDDLRHPQRQGGDLRPRDALRGATAAAGRSIISGTITDASGRTLSGQTTEAFWNSVRHARPLRGRAQLRARRQGDAARTSPSCPGSPTPSSPATPTPACPTPSASTTRPPTRPPRSSASSPTAGLVNLVGGCCGTTPEHIAAIAEAVDGKAPREVPEIAPAHAALRPRADEHHRGLAVRQRRRAHQHHRLGEVPQPDQGRRLRHRASRSPCSRSRPARRSSTSTWTRA